MQSAHAPKMYLRIGVIGSVVVRAFQIATVNAGDLVTAYKNSDLHMLLPMVTSFVLVLSVLGLITFDCAHYVCVALLLLLALLLIVVHAAAAGVGVAVVLKLASVAANVVVSCQP